MKVKMIKTTNEKMKQYENEISNLLLGEEVMVLMKEDGAYIRTSPIKKIIVETRNSVYELEVVEEEEN